MTKRLDVNDPLVFDKWRALYYELTDDEQVQFGYDMEAKYPHQASFTASNFDTLFSAEQPVNVLEVGGWKGELASLMLQNHGDKIKSWVNIDYCKPATEKSVCTDSRYRVMYPSSFHWFKGGETRLLPELFDIFIAAHVIEHLTGEDLAALIKHVAGIPTVMFEAPISENGSEWNGYIGTHILEWGWNQVNEEMERYGYKPQEINKDCYLYKL